MFFYWKKKFFSDVPVQVPGHVKAIRSTIWKNLGSKYESKNPNPYPKKKLNPNKKKMNSDPQH
jgi:hypothetical protein